MDSKPNKIFGRVCGLALFAAAMTIGAGADAAFPQLTPEQAIFQAADAAPAPVPGTFLMTVKAVGRMNGTVYLDSELDYRDQRNLAIAICPDAIAPLVAKFGGDLDKVMLGKNVAVAGAAIRFKVSLFSNDGMPLDTYYYQTHVDVCSADQITLQP